MGDYTYSDKQVRTYSGGMVSGPSNVCKNAPVSLSLSGNIGAIDRWEMSTDGSSWTAINNNTPNYSPIGIIQSTRYRAVINAGSCTKYSSSFTVNVMAGGTAPEVFSAANCGPGSVTLRVNGTGMTYQWRDFGGALLKSGPDNFYTTPVLNSTATYYVSTVPLQGCESERALVPAIINQAPSAPASPAVTPQCGNTLLSIAAAPAGYTHYWQNSPAEFSTDNATLNYTVAETGNYYLRTKNHTTGCWGNLTTKFVSVNAIPAAPPAPTSRQECKTVILSTSTSPAGAVYYWQTSGQGTSTANAQSTFSVTIPGTYYLRTRADNNCWSTASGITVNIGASVNCLAGQNINYIVANNIRKEGIRNEMAIPALPVEENSQAVSYIDGFGRPVQQVVTQGSPSRQDIVQAIDYDNFGREPRKFLPYTTEDNGRFKPGALIALGNYYSTAGVNGDRAITTTPWAETIFEASPLNQIKEQGAPGEAWQIGAGHTVKTSVRSNTTGEVRLWNYDFTTGQCSTIGYYEAEQLMVTEIIDEDGHKSWTYTDKSGRVVLAKKEVSATELAQTFYVFDNFSQIRMVIQPEGVKELMLTPGWTLSEDFINKWCFTYQYNKFGQVTEKKVPGAAPIYYVYNKRHLPVLSQDGNQRRKNQWSFTKYDMHNRVVLTGVYNTTGSISQAQMQQAADLFGGQFESRTATAYTIQYGYTTDQSFPALNSSSDQVYTVNYYDDYNYDNNTGTVDAAYIASGIIPEPVEDYKTTDKITGSRVRVLGTDKMLLTVLLYDKWGRVIQSQKANHLGGMDIITNRLDFAGNLLESRRRHDVGASPLTVKKIYTWDHAARLIKLQQQINNDELVTISASKYNELGQLVKKDLHATNGSSYLQQVDYRYNIRGWLTRINDPALSDPNDLFGMELRYNDAPESQPGSAYFNGNISEMITNNKRENQPKAYAFRYDALSRLNAAGFMAKTAAGWTGQPGAYNEDGITYDLNGNILTLQRYALFNGQTSRQMTHSLKYTYMGNQLMIVDNAVTQPVNPSAGIIK
jgi:hypothetical protein